MKIILDTNVLISAFVFRGKAALVFDHCMAYEEIIISNWILNELTDKLRNKFNVPEHTISEIEQLLKSSSTLATPDNELPSICRDKDDNNILQLAAYLNAELIITGDKDLIVIGKFNKTVIITPAMFIDQITH